MVVQDTVNVEVEGSRPSPAASLAVSLMVDEPRPEQQEPAKNKGGRPPIRQRRRHLAVEIRAGHGVDKAWLLEQLLYLYSAKGIRAQDRLRAIELMARISGYSGKDAEPEDERKALQELMRDMESQRG